jgi:hypothetical protein
MAECGSLRDRCHLHAAKRDTDDRPQHQGSGDPLVIHALMQQRAADGQQHAQFASPHAMSRGRRRTHPFEREDEQGARQ